MKRRVIAILASLAIVAAALASGSAAASDTRDCGTVDGIPIHAHQISCRTARHIYKADMADNLPSGWTCSASLARCYKGEFGSDHYMWWRRTTYRLAGSPVVLGGVVYSPDRGEGWGTKRPETIFNGGDPSGLISDVHWSSWGGPIARGHGHHSLFRPSGGYYSHQVVARLKAKRIGSCEGHRAYLKLFVREPRRPGGPVGPWHSWSGPGTICEPYA